MGLRAAGARLLDAVAAAAPEVTDRHVRMCAYFADSVTETLETTRLPDGGYARSTEGASGSTYHSFMVALTYELLGRGLPRPNSLVQITRVSSSMPRTFKSLSKAEAPVSRIRPQ